MSSDENVLKKAIQNPVLTFEQSFHEYRKFHFFIDFIFRWKYQYENYSLRMRMKAA